LGTAGAGGQVKFLTWTEQVLLRQVIYHGVREDKAAADVVASRRSSFRRQAAMSHGELEPQHGARDWETVNDIGGLIMPKSRWSSLTS
jgi:hypothetical protein